MIIHLRELNAALSACETIDPADVLTASYMLIATFLAGSVSGVGKHERLITSAEFRRNAIIPCMLLESFDCRS